LEGTTKEKQEPEKMDTEEQGHTSRQVNSTTLVSDTHQYGGTMIQRLGLLPSQRGKLQEVVCCLQMAPVFSIEQEAR
jgi:hypothetical protein